MRGFAFWTAKGGTGKTTAAVNLAAVLAERGRRVLVVDLDAQASATRGLGGKPAEGLLAAIRREDSLAELVVETRFKGLSLVQGGPELARAERMLAGETGAETLLDLAVKALPPRRFDVVVFDCPPGVSVLSVGALSAASVHVAAIDPSPFSVAGLGDALDLADAVRQRLNRRLGPSRLLLSRVPRTRAARLVSEGLRERFGERVYRSVIPERAAVVEASAAHEPVVTYAPASPVAEAFRTLAEEVEE